ncbi:hypothetical protein BOTCAL_0282g00020 [Botryotinia calthae]|uniref:2EXR domain-containing protein n=1 Tax=Botryotinia calthae TaxID=38488 RepID=A0A4Y8CV52_9HELO|nr:hypothetical protein BOTCAL_0282g00020 [Botryotinia calthae]
MTHHVVDGFDLGKLDDGCMRMQLQNQGFPVDGNMLSQNQMADEGFHFDGNMLSQNPIADQGSHVDYNMLSHNHMHDGQYAINDDFEMADAEMMDDIVPADDRLSSHEGNRAYESDNDIEMSDIGMMNDVISADNAISPQGEDGENRVGEDADGNAINAAPAPNDYMSQYRIMFLAFNPPPAVPIDPSQRNLLHIVPIEIRHMVYEYYLPKPRTENFDLINSPRATRQQEYRFTIPAIFQVDSDSRAYWNMHYITIRKLPVRAMHKFYGTRNPMPLIFNPKIDTASFTFLNKVPKWGMIETNRWLEHIDSSLPNGLACVRFLDMREVSTKGPYLNISDLQACFFRAQTRDFTFWTLFGGLEKLYFTASNVGSWEKRKLKELDFVRFKDFVLSYRDEGIALNTQHSIPANNVVVRSFVAA